MVFSAQLCAAAYGVVKASRFRRNAFWLEAILLLGAASLPAKAQRARQSKCLVSIKVCAGALLSGLVVCSPPLAKVGVKREITRGS